MELQTVNQEIQGLNTLWLPWTDKYNNYNEFYTHLEHNGAAYEFRLSDDNYALVESYFNNTPNIDFRDDCIYLKPEAPHSTFEKILQILMIKL